MKRWSEGRRFLCSRFRGISPSMTPESRIWTSFEQKM
jgi:hypothetical protein